MVALSEPSETDKYIAWLKTLEPVQVLGNLLQIREEFCVECGGPGRDPMSGKRCQCWNDE